MYCNISGLTFKSLYRHLSVRGNHLNFFDLDMCKQSVCFAPRPARPDSSSITPVYYVPCCSDVGLSLKTKFCGFGLGGQGKVQSIMQLLVGAFFIFCI